VVALSLLSFQMLITLTMSTSSLRPQNKFIFCSWKNELSCTMRTLSIQVSSNTPPPPCLVYLQL